MRQSLLGSLIDWSDSINNGLVGYWPMNEGSGDQVYDISLNGNTGKLVGIVPAIDWQLSDHPVIQGRFLFFPGINNHYVNLDATGVFRTQVFSMSIWGRPQFAASDKIAFVEGLSSSSSNNSNIFWNTNKWIYRYTGTADLLSSSGLSINQWYFIVATCDGSTIRLYVNGIEEATQTIGSAIAVSDVINLGRLPTSTPFGNFNGLLYLPRIHNRPLSFSEVKELYENPNAGILQPRLFTSAVAVANPWFFNQLIMRKRRHA